MCLRKVTKIYRTPSKKIKIGYKYMNGGGDGRVNNPMYKFKNSKKIGSKVICRNNFKIFDSLGNKYPIGFHIYTSKPKFLPFGSDVIVCVCYTDIVCEGTQDYRKVDVAKQMTFIKIM